MSTNIPSALLLKLNSVLVEIKRLPHGRPIGNGLWLRVNDAHAELHVHIEPTALDVKANAAIERGPQIAAAMHARLPGARA